MRALSDSAAASRVSIRDLVAVRQFDCNLHQLMVDRLTGEFRPLLDPVQGFSHGKRVSRLLYYCHEEFLEYLSRCAETLGFNQIECTSAFVFFLALSGGRVDEDVGVEKDLNVHASLAASKSFGQVSRAIACSIPAGARVRHGRA
jgi:hypothetical protein